MRTRPFSTIGLVLAVAFGVGCTDAPITGIEGTSVEGTSTATTPFDDSSTVFRILVDASRDGGVWWFPQDGSYDPDTDHQGQALADYLRLLDYTVRELGRNERITEELAESHNVIVRVGRYGPAYSPQELEVYEEFLQHGENTLLLLNDHLKFDWGGDELAAMLGIEFEGLYDGTVTIFAEHDLTEGVTSLPYIAGSAVVIHDSTGITPLAWLGSGELVMGIIERTPAKIFFLAETNGIQLIPQPFVDNLIAWGF